MPRPASSPRDGSELQRQARALGDPTRHAIFRYVADADRPVDVAELTEHLGLHHNAIRQHLAKLVDAELLVEDRAAATGPGRPRLHYRATAGADSRWGVVGPYERLAGWLAEAVRTGETPVEIGRRVGVRERLGRGAAPDPVGVLVDRMAHRGFAPELRRQADRFEVVLGACPFVSVALVDPDTVCQLHLGIAQGIAESVEGFVIDELVPHDPRRARCVLRGHAVAPAPG